MPMSTEAAALFKEAFDIYDLQHETKKSKEKRDGARARQKFSRPEKLLPARTQG